MKTWKKLLALLMALAMIFTFAACGNDDDGDDGDGKEKTSEAGKEDGSKDDNKGDNNTEVKDPAELICDTWALEADVSAALSKSIEDNYGDALKLPSQKVTFTMTMEFDEEQMVWTLSINESELKKYISEVADSLVDYLVEYAESQGMSKAELEEKCQSENGMSLDEYALSVMEEAMESAAGSLEQSTTVYYKMDGDKLYMDPKKSNVEEITEDTVYMVFEVSTGKLVIKELCGAGADRTTQMFSGIGVPLAWTFTNN